MLSLRRLAVASTGAIFVLVTIGGLVRATKSGLGCGTNWPDCPGEVTRALVIELSHRAVAGVVVVLLATLAVTALRSYRSVQALVWPAVAAFGLVIFQALLGAVVVWLELEAESVVLHLATAMALLALSVYLTAATFALEGRLNANPDRSVSRHSAGAAAAIFVLLLVGSYVTGSNAGMAFPDWPLMNGRLIPDLSVDSQAVHFLHRALAVLVGAGVLLLTVRVTRRKKELPEQARLAHIAAGLFAVEVMIGAANVWTSLSPIWVTAHLFVGAAIWASLVGITVVSHPEVKKAVGKEKLRGREPVLEPAG